MPLYNLYGPYYMELSIPRYKYLKLGSISWEMLFSQKDSMMKLQKLL